MILTTTNQAYIEHLQPLEHIDIDAYLVASVWDLEAASDDKPIIYMEHGCGLQAHREEKKKLVHAKADLILSPNQLVARTWLPQRRAQIIGTPKLDALLRIPAPEDGTIAFSFHWSGLGHNMRNYEGAIRELAKTHKLVGHSHPRIARHASLFYSKIGIEYIPSFEEVVKRADVYCCDHSSTIYEWAALGRKVVVLRRDNGKHMVYSSGLLYDYMDNIGARADWNTLQHIDRLLKEYRNTDVMSQQEYDNAIVHALFPYLGHSVERAEEVIATWIHDFMNKT